MRSAAAVQQDLEGAQLLVDDGWLRAVQEVEASHHVPQHRHNHLVIQHHLPQEPPTESLLIPNINELHHWW